MLLGAATLLATVWPLGQQSAGALPSRDWSTYSNILVPPNAFLGYHSNDPSSYSSLETRAGRMFDIGTDYQSSADELMGNPPGGTDTSTGSAQWLRNRGEIPRVDLMPNKYRRDCGITATAQPDLWQWVAAGNADQDWTYLGRTCYGVDSQLLSLKRIVNANGYPSRLMVSLVHEADSSSAKDANGDSFGTSSSYRAMWQHYWNEAAALGVTNLVWYLDFGGATSKWGSTLTDTGSDGLYPGHKYVDWVGWDPYNWCTNLTSPSDTPSPWHNPSTINSNELSWWKAHFKVGGKPTLAQVTGSEGVYKPALLGETAAPERPSTGTCGTQGDSGNRRDFINQYAALLGANGAASGIIKGIIWFGSVHTEAGTTNDWHISSDTPQGWNGLADAGLNPAWAP